jgi:glycerophosphoryl diester phosphodiesterase
MFKQVSQLCRSAIPFALVALLDGACVAQTAAPELENFERVQDARALPDGWKIVSGDWKVKGGALIAESLNSEAYVTFGETSWQNYEVEASVTFHKVRNPSRWLSVLVRSSKDGTVPWSQVPIRFDTTQPNGMEFAVRTPSNNWSIRQKAAASSRSTLNQHRRVKVIVRGSHVEGYLDGQLVVSSQLCVDRSAGCIGFGVSGCIAAFDDVVVRHLPSTIRNTPTVPVPPCDVVAHRGFSAFAPENTLVAIREAIKAGATGCEFDVYCCHDGTVVLMHDKTVDRTTDGTGLVTELSLRQLRQLDAGSWKDVRYAGEKIPTLTEALKLLKGTDCQPVIEIKMEGISKRVVDDIRALDMVEQVAVIAFSETVVREIRELEPHLTCAWLCSKTLEGTAAQQADWLQARARECSAELLDLNFNMLSGELVAELKRRGLGVWTWTVNEAVVMQAIQQWGVDSITTDRPDLLRR